MNDEYYRSLIDRVSQHDEQMWSDCDDELQYAASDNDDRQDGFEDFSRLWEILSDDDPTISPDAYLEGAALCLSSFYGAAQDHAPVWDSILAHYRAALDSNGECAREFRDAFIRMAESFDENDDPDCLPQFTAMMHMAVKSGDPEMCMAILNCANCQELWESVDAHPEWGIWLAAFSDFEPMEIPHTPEAASALEELTTYLAGSPGMEWLQDLSDNFQDY